MDGMVFVWNGLLRFPVCYARIILQFGQNNFTRTNKAIIVTAETSSIPAELQASPEQRQVSLPFLRMQGTRPPAISLYPCTSSHRKSTLQPLVVT